MASFNVEWRWWQPLIKPDGTATPIFIDLLTAFFNALDPQHTGYLWPETYSAFLDVFGFQHEHNLWKHQLKPISGGLPVNNADSEFKITLENFQFEHVVVDRDPQRPFRLPQGIGGTPLLTLRGFIDIMTLETAYLPERGITGLNRALQHYGVWSQLGPMPRSCLPATAPVPVQIRVQSTGVMAQQRKQQMLDATAAQHRMEARGRQNALDLIDTVYIGGYVYRPGLI